jgi:glucokinase
MSDYFIGIDVGGTMIKGALFDQDGSLVAKEEIPTLGDKGPEAFIDNLVSLADLLQGPKNKALGMGIGIAGLLDKERRTLLESPNLPLLNNLPLKQNLESRLDLPVSIENDANAAALGELWAGDCKGLKNFLLLTLGTGIGGGLILDGKLWTGELGKASEFGHVIVEPGGARCGCGKQGCLEAYSSGSAMVRIARQALDKGENSTLQVIYRQNPDDITPKAIYTEARNGDELSNTIFREAAIHLARAIANVNNLLDIHTFIIGGGVSKASHIFHAGLIQDVQQLVFSSSKDNIRVIISKLGNDAGVFGAGYLAKLYLV